MRAVEGNLDRGGSTSTGADPWRREPRSPRGAHVHQRRPPAPSCAPPTFPSTSSQARPPGSSVTFATAASSSRAPWRRRSATCGGHPWGRRRRSAPDKVTAVLSPDKEEALASGVLSVATIKKTEEEVERLTRLKAGRMKELVLKRRLELENICRTMHVEPDASTVPEKSIALIDSGLVNPSELMASIDDQIAKAREELQSRRDIMEKINKWLLACEEEKWLEEYNLDENRFSTGRVARLNLKRAEKARLIITKIPAVIDNLISRTLAWESERKKPFLYDGARLVAVLEEHKQARLRQEEERRRLREQKKLRTLLSEKETMPHLKRPGSSFGRAAEPCAVNRKRVDAGRLASSSSSAPSVRSGASSSSGGSGSGAAELPRPRSSAAGAGHHCGEFLVRGPARRLSAAPPFGYGVAAPAKGSGSMSSSSLALP